MDIVQNEAADMLEELAKKAREGKLSNVSCNKIINDCKETTKLQDKIDKGDYLPTPFDTNTYNNTVSTNLSDGTDININKDISKEPFIQMHPVLNYRLLHWNKISFTNDSSIKLLLYVASIIKRDCNYVYFTRDDVNRHTGMNNKTFAASLSSLIKMEVLVPINNLKSYYILNHNFLFNGSKIRLCKWVNDNTKERKLEFIYLEGKTTPVVSLNEDYKKKILGRIKSRKFEPFEEIKIE
jgi:hypothetical protein